MAASRGEERGMTASRGEELLELGVGGRGNGFGKKLIFSFWIESNRWKNAIAVVHHNFPPLFLSLSILLN